MNKILKIVIAIVVLALVIWGISSFFEDDNASTNSEKETIKIGIVMPLTGVRADAGEYTKNALDIALT